MKSCISQKSFTVIVPSYNCTKFIAKNIASIENQNYPKNLIQVLVIDDGSTDNLKQLIETIQAKSSINIEYHYKENGHWGSVMNYVNEHHLIKNDIVVILDADDIFLKNCFKKANLKFKDADIILTCFRVWNGKHLFLKVLPYFSFYRKITPINCAPAFLWPGALFYRKEIFANIGKIKENLPFQDNILAAKAFAISKKVSYCNFSSGAYYCTNATNTMHSSWDDKRFKIHSELLDELNAMGWQNLTFFNFALKGFRQQCKKHNRIFYINEKIDLNLMPFFMRAFIYVFFYRYINKNFFKLNPTKSKVAD